MFFDNTKEEDGDIIYKTTIISEFMQMGNLIVKQFSIYGYLWQKKATSEDRN